METATRLLTPDDVWAMLESGELSSEGRWELVDGELIDTRDTLMGQGRPLMKVACELELHVRQVGGGVACVNEEVVLTLPGGQQQIRVPDASFFTDATLAPIGGKIPIGGYTRAAPDFVIEVSSRNDKFRALLRKVRDYFAAGVRLVWIVDPFNRSATIYRPDGSATHLIEEGVLDGGDVLPGLRVELAALFD